MLEEAERRLEELKETVWRKVAESSISTRQSAAATRTAITRSVREVRHAWSENQPVIFLTSFI